MSWWALPFAFAWAQEPDVRVLDDRRTVRGVIEVAADADAVRGLVQDAWRTQEASCTDVDLARKGEEGDCVLVEYTIHHSLKTVRYTGRLCPTGTGSTVSLVQSDDFDDYLTTFVIEDLGPGRARITYDVRTQPSFPVPWPIIKAQTLSGVTEFLGSLKRFVER